MMRAYVIAFALSTAATAVADPAPPPNAAAVKEARRHFEAGQRLIQQKHFADAIRELEAAYQLDPLPEHLHNLGVAHHLAGDDADAVQYYRLFLDEGPTGKAAADAKRYLASLETKLADQRAAQSKVKAEQRAQLAAQRTNDDQRFGELQRDTGVVEAEAAALQKKVDDLAAEEAAARKLVAQDNARLGQLTALSRRWEQAARDAPSGGGRGRRLWGTGLLAVGAGTFAFSILDYSNNSSTRTTSGSLAAGGAVLSLAGAGLVLWGELASTDPREPSAFDRVSVAPAIGAHAASLVVSSGF